MTRDFDRHVAEVQVRIAIMNGYTAHGKPVTKPQDKCIRGKRKSDQRLLCATRSLLGTVLLWLDEAQDLTLAKSASDTETTLRMLKTLMQGDTGVILILSGTKRLGEMANIDKFAGNMNRSLWLARSIFPCHGAPAANI